MDKGMGAKQAALWWLDEGIASIPLYFMSKVPAVKWVEFKTRLPSENLIDYWYQEPRNIAVVSGWQKLCVLDFDCIQNYSIWMAWQLQYNPKILDTRKSSTSRGIHLFYFIKEDAKLKSIPHALFEIKTNGRLITVPPSIHPSGTQYRTLNDTILVVSIEQILNYSSVHFQSHVSIPVSSRYAPTSLNGCSLVEQIKSKIKILSFFPNAVKVDNEGRYYRTDCPFHKRRSNFWIDSQLNICGCYAGCGNFDVIELFARLNNISNKEAILLLSREL